MSKKIHLHTEGHGGHESGGHATGLDLLITILLGLAAITGAYAALKNEERDHEATVQFSQGIRNFDDAGQFYATGNVKYEQDQAVFLAFATAVHDDKADLAKYIQNQLMSAELKAGVKWFESSANTDSAHPKQSPFSKSDPDYGIAQYDEADASTKESKANFVEARDLQSKADHYTLVEVILATALFLYGIAGVSRNRILKLGTLGAGAAIYVLSIGLLISG